MDMEKNLESKMQLIQLKIFLSKVSNYSITLDAGMSADQTLEDLLQEEGIHHISKYGKCYYTNEKRQQCWSK